MKPTVFIVAKQNASVRSAVSFLWDFPFEPLLFGLIGAELDLSAIDASVLANSVLVVAIGITLRTVAAFFAVAAAGFTLKERLFISLAWLPKATVQVSVIFLSMLCFYLLQRHLWY